jgi:hypothetical protein
LACRRQVRRTLAKIAWVSAPASVRFPTDIFLATTAVADLTLRLVVRRVHRVVFEELQQVVAPHAQPLASRVLFGVQTATRHGVAKGAQAGLAVFQGHRPPEQGRRPAAEPDRHPGLGPLDNR